MRELGDDAFESAADETDRELRDELKHLALDKEKLKNLFPEQDEQDKAKQLIDIVKSNQEENEKKKQFIENAQNLAGPALKLISTLV